MIDMKLIDLLTDSKNQLGDSKLYNDHIDETTRSFNTFVDCINHADNFNHSYVLSDYQATIADNLFANLFLQNGKLLYKINEKTRDFRLFCANLIVSNLRGKSIRIFLNRNTWGQTMYTIAGYFTIEKNGILSTLQKNDLIWVQRGNEMLNRCSRIWATPKFLHYFTPLEPITHIPVNLVVLRDEEGYTINYRENAMTKRIRLILEKANLVNSKHNVVYTDGNGQILVLGTYLHVVFNINFLQGGRSYTGGSNGYQSLNRKYRRTIQIDGEATVELDFSGCQPRILYALKGIQYDQDPYTAVYENPELRKILKKIFMPMLNALTKRRAIMSCEFEFLENAYFMDILESKNITIQEIVELTIKQHEPIADEFFNNAGLKAQFYDGQIALKVIEHFTSKKIPILAIHDSFLVKREFERELWEVMDQNYSKIMGGFRCQIDKKN